MYYTSDTRHGSCMKKGCFSLLIFVFLTFPPGTSWADMASSQGDGGRQTSAAARWTVMPLIKIYQTYLSPFVITKCPSWPNCSRYASQAVAKHGAAMGAFMTVDRLIHEAGKIKQSPKVYVEGRGYLIYDPLDHNDFWWTTPSTTLSLPDIPQMSLK
jgi:hypothetical protein